MTDWKIRLECYRGIASAEHRDNVTVATSKHIISILFSSICTRRRTLSSATVMGQRTDTAPWPQRRVFYIGYDDIKTTQQDCTLPSLA